mmetsp:Transcript_17402/g.19530  ORF Transcript_17402/g.19530 Transcript_17402/m.19530 type:complete len:367 (+) Transcript_17402:36-1136(+)
MAKSSVMVVQSIFILFIFTLTFLSSLLPNLIPWCKKNRIFTCIANAFSGGVFLAIAIMHILPEVSESYNEWKGEEHEEHEEEEHEEEEEHQHDHSLSLPFVLVFVGYALILLIDKVLFDTHNLTNNGCQNQKMPSSEKKDLKEINNQEIDEEDSHGASRSIQFVAKISEALKVEEVKEDPSQQESKVRDIENPAKEEEGSELSKKDNSSHIEKVSYDKLKLLNITSITLMIGLSTHSIFEGIVVGLENELSEVWSLIIAITLHKWAAAMSLGVSINATLKGQNFLIIVLLCIFSAATPIGIGIGMLISGESEITEIIFNSLTVGTFIYIACSEIIAEEFSNPKNKYVKMGVFILGAGFIALISFIE